MTANTQSLVGRARAFFQLSRLGVWAGLAALVFGVWALNTPEGVLGKADAVGYAVCHRIDLRSFHLGARALPLCARCTGMYLGVVVGVAGMLALGRSRAGRLPPKRVLAGLILYMLAFGVDGVNSFASLLPGLPHLYAPNNTLRLFTGLGAGLTLAVLVYSIFNQTSWRDWQDRPVLAGLRELGLLTVAASGVALLVLSDQPLALYPLAVLSALGVLLVLMLLFATVAQILLRQENRAVRWVDTFGPLLAGLALAGLQVGLIDALRFAVFHTWGGLLLPG